MALGITVAAEVVGKFLFNNGFATQLRPRKYMTVSRETVDCLAGDVYELINFVVIESQRILYVESVPVSVAVSICKLFVYKPILICNRPLSLPSLATISASSFLSGALPSSPLFWPSCSP